MLNQKYGIRITEKIILYLKELYYFQNSFQIHPNTFKDYLKRTIKENYHNLNEYEINLLCNEIYGLLILNEYIYEDLDERRLKVGKGYIQEFIRKKKFSKLIFPTFAFLSGVFASLFSD